MRQVIKRKKIKNVNVITRFFLKRKGKKDANKNLLYKDGDNMIRSPYIHQELNTYMSAIDREKEILSSYISAFRVNMQMNYSYNNKIEYLYSPQPQKTNNEEDIVLSALNSLKEDKQNSNNIDKLSINDEIYVTYIRSKQIFSIFKSKMYTYWDGVMLASRKNKLRNTQYEIPNVKYFENAFIKFEPILDEFIMVPIELGKYKEEG